uniref:Fibronectin type-III domain-containing protein n=1 Tax=Cyprinus carpio TaxID=7962 RepID=A0A8C1QH51_CYPCA
MYFVPEHSFYEGPFSIPECTIIAISSPTASSLLVQWNRLQGITNYFLDLRVVNDSNSSPVVASVPGSMSMREVFGLKPGTWYKVILKGFLNFTPSCTVSRLALTAPETSQIIYSKALSSTAILLEWDWVQTAQQYFLLINSTLTGERYNMSLTNNNTVVENLRPATTYDCYVVTSNAGGLGARSRIRTITTLIQPPVVITVLQIRPQSAQISWQPVDKVLVYQITVKNWNSLNTTIYSNTVFGTTLDVQNISPCSSYQISVSSLNALLEAGEPRQVNYTTSTLGPVTSVSVSYTCASGSAVVSWTTVLGATTYRATAVSHSGTVLSCSSSSTECEIRNLACGENYMVHVTALSGNCESTGNATTSFQTVPCAPSDLMLYRECSSNVIVFSWAPNNYSAYYYARGVDSTGKVMECMTTETSCFFTDTNCGRLYNFTVSGSSSSGREQCSTATSSMRQIRTAPCRARNMRTSVDCQTGLLTSSWEGADGALRYTVDAFGNRGNQSHYMCSSLIQSCTISDINCGESLTMLISAMDNECSSVLSLGEVGQTVPCVPQNVSALMDCGSDSITLTWEASLGAFLYFATAVDQLGTAHTCTSSDTKCKFSGLRCGSIYNASLIASNSHCNSSVSDSISVETGTTHTKKYKNAVPLMSDTS